MENILSAGGEADHGIATLKTTFASRQQAASLIHALDLTPKEIEQVSGGLPLNPIDRLPDCISFPVPDCVVRPVPDCIMATF
jgi:hypothetical protein